MSANNVKELGVSTRIEWQLESEQVLGIVTVSDQGIYQVTAILSCENGTRKE